MSKWTEPKWYHTAWIIGVAFVFLPPLGLILLVLSNEVKQRTKGIALAFFFLLVSLIGAYEYSSGIINMFYIEFVGETCSKAGHILAQKGYCKDAARLFLHGVSVKPLNAELRLRLGLCEQDLLHHSKALHNFMAARQMADEYESNGEKQYSTEKVMSTIRIIDILIDSGRIKLAEKYMSILREKSNRRLNSYSSYGLVIAKLAIDRGDFLKAEGELRALIFQFETSFFGKIYEAYAHLETKRGRHSKALYYLCEALRYREGDKSLELEILKAGQKKLVPLKSYIKMMRGRRNSLGAEKVVEVMSNIRSRFPGFEYNDGCLYVEGYVMIKHLDQRLKAARRFEELASNYPESESYGKALWEASKCYKKLGLPEHRKKCLKELVANLDSRSYIRGEARMLLKEIKEEEQKEEG